MVNQNLNQILEHFHENRLSHAFLIETNSQEQTLQELKQILKEINLEIKEQETLVIMSYDRI